MESTIPYGSTEKTEILDDIGSTKTTTLKFDGSVTAKPVRIRYAIRHRTDKTDIATIAKIASELLADSFKLDAELKLERTKFGEQSGYFNLVECYTVLEY